jgi:hypothetical protein
MKTDNYPDNKIAERLRKITERMQIAQEKEQLLIELRDALSKVKTLSGFYLFVHRCSTPRFTTTSLLTYSHYSIT